MREVVIRKENYGMIVFNPYQNVFYRLYDDNMMKDLNEACLSNNYQMMYEKYPEICQKIGLYCEHKRFIDNTCFDKNIFVPIEAYFDYTAVCNGNCDYCYNKKYLGNTTMDEETVRKVLENFSELGIMRVHLAGGEPTINYKGLKNYLEYGRKLELRISMATNGTYLVNDDISELLTTSDLISVSISIDNANREKNDLTRGKGVYDKIMQGIKNLNKFKEKNHSDVEICFKPVYYPDITNEEIESLLELAIKNGVNKVKFANPERCDSHEQGYYGKIKNDYYETIKRIQKIINEKHYPILITNVTNPVLYDFTIGIEENKGCIGAQELITINPDGRITPCLMNHTYLGSIYDYNSLKDFLVNSEKLKAYRKLISSYDCANCQLHESCRGGCQVRKKVEYGNIQKIDPLCPKLLVPEKEKEKTLVRKINVYHSL